MVIMKLIMPFLLQRISLIGVKDLVSKLVLTIPSYLMLIKNINSQIINMTIHNIFWLKLKINLKVLIILKLIYIYICIYYIFNCKKTMKLIPRIYNKVVDDFLNFLFKKNFIIYNLNNK